MLEAMRAIDALGDDIYGYWFSMNCAGCNAFTFLPFIWASGGDVLSDDYTEATITSDPIVRDALAFYNTIWEEGSSRGSQHRQRQQFRERFYRRQYRHGRHGQLCDPALHERSS